MPAKSVADQLRDLPPSTIMVKNGRVMAVEQWTLWNLVPSITMHIQRLDDGTFVSYIGDPEHGGGSSRAEQLASVLEGLHPEIKQGYLDLFALENPDEAAIHAAGFSRYKIVY